MKKYVLAILIISLILGCTSNSNKKQEETKYEASLRFDWYTYMLFSGEIVGQKLFDEKYNLNLVLEPGSESVDPVKLVIAGNNTFGVIAAENILIANEKGADLVILGVVNYHSPGAFLSLKNSGIKEPKDWEGKKVGVLPGGSTEYIYQALKKKTNLNEDKIEEVICPFDLGTFIQGAYDVRPIFVYAEPISLDEKGLEYSIIYPKDYGISFRGTCYFCKRETIEKHPEMVQAFINTVADGWNYVIKNPEKAIDILVEFDNTLDKNRELTALKKGLPYFEGFEGKPLYCDFQAWKEMENTLIELGLISSANIENVIHNEYLENYYKKND